MDIKARNIATPAADAPTTPECDLNVSIKPIDEVKCIEDYDAILIGYWVDKGGPNKEAKEFMKRIKNKRVGIFATLGAYPDSNHGFNSFS